LPEAGVKNAAEPSLEWHLFADLSAALLYELLQFRQDVFVVEQASPYRDLDGRDRHARQLSLRVAGGLAGALRLIPHEPERRVAIGRLAVAPQHRRRGFASRLMDEALLCCRRDYPGWTITLSAQAYLVPFYRNLGFAAVSAPYDDYGVPHVDMELRG